MRDAYDTVGLAVFAALSFWRNDPVGLVDDGFDGIANFRIMIAP